MRDSCSAILFALTGSWFLRAVVPGWNGFVAFQNVDREEGWYDSATSNRHERPHAHPSRNLRDLPLAY